MILRNLLTPRLRYVSGIKINKTPTRLFSNQRVDTSDSSKVSEKFDDGYMQNVESTLKRLSDSARKYYSWKGKLTLGILSIFIAGGSYLYFVRDDMRSLVVEEVSTVASKSLEDDKILTNAEQLSKLVIHNILHDDEIKKETQIFVKDILLSPDTKDSLSNLLLSVIQSEEFIEYVASKLKKILIGILEADDTRNIVMSQVETILQDPSIKQAVQNLLNDVTTTEEVKLMIAEFFKSVLASKLVHDQGSKLGRQITNDVIADKDVQHKAGEAIWAAFAHSVTPSYFKKN